MKFIHKTCFSFLNIFLFSNTSSSGVPRREGNATGEVCPSRLVHNITAFIAVFQKKRFISKRRPKLITWVVVAKLCLTLCNPVDCSLPSSSGHGISRASMLEWVAISFSRESSWHRDQNYVSSVFCIGRQIRLSLSHQGSLVTQV